MSELVTPQNFQSQKPLSEGISLADLKDRMSDLSSLISQQLPSWEISGTETELTGEELGHFGYGICGGDCW